MIRRVATVLRQVLVSIDQLAQVLVIGLCFIVGLTSTAPSADETISSYVGRGEMRQRPWAIFAARIIDKMFVLLGEAPGHCRRNVETAFLGAAPTP